MGKTAAIFPGQGAQSVGMGQDVAAASPRAAAVFARANEALGFDLRSICFEGPAEVLERTDIQQPAIFVTSVALWEALIEKGMGPDRFDVMAGLSLGEYTALHLAGAMNFKDALLLVHRRGVFMQQAATAVPSGMVSLVGADATLAERLCAELAEGDVLSPANFNCPGQIVVSGSKAACERAAQRAGDYGCRAMPLKVAGAFHSAIMQPAADDLSTVLAATPMTPPRVPVVSNVTARPHAGPDDIRATLCDQLTHPVRWQESVEVLITQGFDTFIEIGPGKVLTGLMKKINLSVRAVNVSGADALGSAVDAAA